MITVSASYGETGNYALGGGTGSGSGTVCLTYTVPQAEYMYGCTATCVGMLLGYYDRYGYMGYDVSDLIDGTVELNARGLDGNKYDMDAFDTVLGSAIASVEYKNRFVGTSAAEEFDSTFADDDLTLNTSEWNCIADYLGTGQFWRGNSDNSTSFYPEYSLESIRSWTFTNKKSSGGISVQVPGKYISFLYGLDLYVKNAGYELDAAKTENVRTDNDGGDFTFDDFCREIDAGRAVLIHLKGHTVLAYGYDRGTREIIFDDTYRNDCRMTWGGEYYYSNSYLEMYAASLVYFDTSELEELSLMPDDPEYSLSTEDPTNGSVIISVTFDPDSVLNEYSFNGGDWSVYSGDIAADANGTYYFRSKGVEGIYSDISVCEISNIDREAPAAPVIRADITDFTREDVTLTAAFSDDSVIRRYRIGQGDWLDCSGKITVTENCTVYFLAGDAAGNESTAAFKVANIDRTAPAVPSGFKVTVEEYTAGISWRRIAGDGGSAISGYYIRCGSDPSLSGDGWFTAENEFTLQELAIGTFYYQVRTTDALGNISGWSECRSFEVTPGKVKDLQSGPGGVSWELIADVDSYTAEISADNFRKVFSIETADSSIDTFALPEGSWRWRVKAAGGEFSEGEKIVSEAADEPQEFFSDDDGHTDIFFARAQGTWSCSYAARHEGTAGWEGTGELKLLTGKNRLADIFTGSKDANILVMTDDENGDALFVDDIYTALPGDETEQRERIVQIDEIRAGAGSDIVDLTSGIFSSSSGVTIYGGDGSDVIWANDGENTLYGDAGSDTLCGGSGNDSFIGGSGDDFMHGGGGTDRLYFGGDWGNDTVCQVSGGTVELYFESGDIVLDESTGAYICGDNSVSFDGDIDFTIRIFKGYEGAMPAGAFLDAASGSIFHDPAKGMLA